MASESSQAAPMDRLKYFPVQGRGEAIRMLYTAAGKEYENIIIPKENWNEHKPTVPFGKLPVLYTSQGEICKSNVIARHVAKKLGMMGSDTWEETLHDLVVEVAHECRDGVSLIYRWKYFKTIPEPEDKETPFVTVEARWLEGLNYIQSIADERQKKYIVGDELGLAEIWLYAKMQGCVTAIPNIMTLTPWAAKFTQQIAEHPKLKKYISERPESMF